MKDGVEGGRPFDGGVKAKGVDGDEKVDGKEEQKEKLPDTSEDDVD